MKKRVSLSLAVLGIAVAFTLILAPAAGAQPGEFVNGKLQPLADGFPNHAITLINIDDPGTRDGIYARSIQRALKDISPVDILISDEPSATLGTFYTARDTITRRGGKEGYYPYVTTMFGNVTDLLLEPITKETGMTEKMIKPVIRTETYPSFVVQRKNAPWGPSFVQMVAYAKDNPGKLRYISQDVGSGTDIGCEWLMFKLGIKVTKIPQPGHTAVLAAVGGGGGDFGMTNADNAIIGWQSGRTFPTVLWDNGTTVPEPFTNDPRIITYQQLGFDPPVPNLSTLGFAVNQEVPDSHVEWLYKLFKAAAETDFHKMREKQIPGLRIDIIGPKEANAEKLYFLKEADPVLRAIGLHIDVQKK